MNVNRTYENLQAARVNKNSTNTIEINGQLYDADTGAPLESSSEPAPSTAQSDSKKPPTDGSKHPINIAVRHAPKSSEILMRSSVKKPELSLKRQIQISESTDRVVEPPPSIEASSLKSLSTTRADRLQRAATAKQSDKISHTFITPNSEAPTQPTDDSSKQPVEPASQLVPPPEPPKSQTDILLERGLNRAKAHEETSLQVPKTHLRRVSLVAVPIAIVLALLIFGGHTFTNLQLKIASAKVGFNTSLPAYKPAGFQLNQMSYNSGIFASDFSAKNSPASYTITQTSTDWSTQDFLNNYVSLNIPKFSVVQLGSRTLYLYGNGNATWIKGHIWYQIVSDGSLNESQIIDLANSL